jgi:hypothetical protein
MKNRVAGRMLTAVAALVLLPSPLHGASVPSQMGATSQATLQLSLSVRPRIYLGVKPSRQPQDNSFAERDLCAWSTSPTLRFRISLQPASRDPHRKSSIVHLPTDAMSSRSGLACAENGREFPDQAKLEAGHEPLLLLIVPD